MRPQKEILEIFDILSANDPAPKSELEYSNAFTLLVAIMLSAHRQRRQQGDQRAVQGSRYAGQDGCARGGKAERIY